MLEEAGPDHAALLERYQDQMEEVSVADRTILFQAALEEVRAGADLARHPLLLLDVPIHSAIERAFLVELASAAKEVVFTCPAGDLRTLGNLRMVPGVQENAAPAVPGDSSLARLGFYLFSETTPPEGKLDDEVVFFSAPGEERESVEIARRVFRQTPPYADPFPSFASSPVKLPKEVVAILDRTLELSPKKRPKMTDVRDVLERRLLHGKHRAVVTYGAMHELSTAGKSLSLKTGVGAIAIKYDGLLFTIESLDGDVFINNATAQIGDVLPASCVITLGASFLGSGRTFVPFNVSHPGVVL